MIRKDIVIAILAFGLAGCGSSIPNRAPVGERFPSVQGQALSGDTVRIPDAFKGKPVILVLGYKMDTQFDIDRWGIGFFTADLALPPVIELPTIPGLIPSLFKGTIDAGMRKGIPQESWKDVVTVYGTDGSRITEWTGTENPRNARIVLLDEEGTVLWFHDKGYGLPPLRDLLQKLKERQHL
jgi:hypothetical protein